jgi:hypothetical protein
MNIRRRFQMASTPGGLVCLVPGVTPRTPLEILVADRLAAAPPVCFAALVDWLAGRLLAEHRGDPASWQLESGLWGPWLFRREAAGALEALVGKFLTIEEDREEASGAQAGSLARGVARGASPGGPPHGVER